MNHDFRLIDGINSHGDYYMPSPVKKSAAILKLQQKWEQPGNPAKSSRTFNVEYSSSPFLVSSVKIDGDPVKIETSVTTLEPIMMPCEDPASDGTNHEPAKPALVKLDTLKEMEAENPKKKVYKQWHFGKMKKFTRPVNTQENNAAAVIIQKIARGGMQRLHYNIERLQRLLDRKEEITNAAKAKVMEHIEERKKKILEKMQQQEAKAMKRIEQASAAAIESQNIIAYLRKENRKLREKNDKLFLAIRNIKEQNKRLEDANSSTDSSYSILGDHTKQIEATHTKLTEVVPMYKQRVDEVLAAVEVRRQFCFSEHKIKLMYVKLMGDILDKMDKLLEKHPAEKGLAEEVMEKCLELEAQDHSIQVPPQVGDIFTESSSTLFSDDSDAAEIETHALTCSTDS